MTPSRVHLGQRCGRLRARRGIREVRSGSAGPWLYSREGQVRSGTAPPDHLGGRCRVRSDARKPSHVGLTAPESYNAKVHPHLPKLKALLADLSEKSSLHPEVVVIRHPFDVSRRGDWDASWKDWNELVAEGRDKKLGRTVNGEIEWRRFDFNWPLWILFSSGTTGTWRDVL